MNLQELKNHVDGKDFAATLARLYGESAIGEQRVRWHRLVAEGVRHLPDGPLALFSAPGRSELGGNHTDHQRGCGLAAAVPLDTIALAVPRADSLVQVWADGYPPFEVDLSVLTAQVAEKSTSAALVRGVADFFVQHG